MQDPPTFPPIKVIYEPLPGDPVTKWPLVKIRLSHNKIYLPQPILALVDSGANISILHPQIAQALKINNISYSERGRSVSGNYKSGRTPTNLKVEIYGYEFLMRFAVINNPSLAFGCILGEDSIFHWARLDFQKFKGFFEIKFRKDIH